MILLGRGLHPVEFLPVADRRFEPPAAEIFSMAGGTPDYIAQSAYTLGYWYGNGDVLDFDVQREIW